MIVHELKAEYYQGEAIIREFISLMDSTFSHYRSIRNQFFQAIPENIGEERFASLVSKELRARLFNKEFCEGLGDALKSLRRALIRLEDLIALQAPHTNSVVDLKRVGLIGERVEALYQTHWESYRYQDGIPDKEMVNLVLEVDRIGHDWDGFLNRFSTISGLMETLSGTPAPAQHIALRVSYAHPELDHFSSGTVRELLAFFEACYSFVCGAGNLDLAANPLRLQHVEISDPVELVLAVPSAAVTPFRRFLQYLFLKDMLKRDALIKVLMEAVIKEFSGDKKLTPAKLLVHQKEISARLKTIPVVGLYEISDRKFPADSVAVMGELVASLDKNGIKYGNLIGSTAKKSGKSRNAPAPKTVDPPANASSTPSSAQQTIEAAVKPTESKEHIRVLTDSG